MWGRPIFVNGAAQITGSMQYYVILIMLTNPVRLVTLLSHINHT